MVTCEAVALRAHLARGREKMGVSFLIQADWPKHDEAMTSTPWAPACR